MASLRKKDGISGFLKREESPYDAFGAGHASTSISAAIGYEVASKINKIDRTPIKISNFIIMLFKSIFFVKWHLVYAIFITSIRFINKNYVIIHTKYLNTLFNL